MRKQLKRLMLFLGALTLAAGGSARHKAESAAPAESSVQIVSIKVKPDTIHKELKPNTAQIIVVVRCIGPVPPGAWVAVEVGDYSAEPAGNHAVYPKPWVGESFLKKGSIVARLEMQGGPDTKIGSLVVAASIIGYYFPKNPAIKKPATENGLAIRTPLAPSAWQAKVKTLAP